MANFLDKAEPFDLFYVVHDGSLFQKSLCCLTMTPLFILGYLALNLFIYDQNQKRNALVLCALLTSIILNKILKRAINHPRPHPDIYHGRGMPSDHAQFAVLFAGYCHQLLSHHNRFNWSQFHKRKHRLYIAIIWLWAVGVCYSRQVLLFHDVYQLLIGSIIGLLLSLFWYTIDAKYLPSKFITN